MRRRQTVVIDCGTWWGTTHEARAELSDQEYIDFLRSHFSNAIGQT
jgi:hypothetical protein